MLVYEFVNQLGQKIMVKENEDGSIDVGYIPFSKRMTSWTYADEMVKAGKYEYKGKFDLVNSRY